MEAAVSALEKWYVARCNGDWEHQRGVTIETLDNPGWRMKIDLHETKAADRMLDMTRIERNEKDWIIYWAAESRFEAACGPMNLSEAVDIFIKWFEA